MAMLNAALADAKKNFFSPAALLSGGVSLSVTGTKAMKDSMKPPPLAAPAPGPEAQPAKQAARPATAGASGTKSLANSMGNGGTLLAGLGGVDPTTLNLGKNTLLGQ